MALSLGRHRTVPARVLYFEAIISEHFFAGLDAVAQRLTISQTYAAAFVESKLSVDQITMVLDEPLDADRVAVANLLIRLECHNDVAIGLEPLACNESGLRRMRQP